VGNVKIGILSSPYINSDPYEQAVRVLSKEDLYRDTLVFVEGSPRGGFEILTGHEDSRKASYDHESRFPAILEIVLEEDIEEGLRYLEKETPMPEPALGPWTLTGTSPENVLANWRQIAIRLASKVAVFRAVRNIRLSVEAWNNEILDKATEYPFQGDYDLYLAADGNVYERAAVFPAPRESKVSRRVFEVIRPSRGNTVHLAIPHKKYHYGIETYRPGRACSAESLPGDTEVKPEDSHTLAGMSLCPRCRPLLSSKKRRHFLRHPELLTSDPFKEK
jgi:hypothetical protein